MADPDNKTEIGRLPLAEEVVRIRRRRRRQRVRVSVTTTEDARALEAVLRRRRAEIERVPIGREVEAPPPIRREGDTIIVPVLEERAVVVHRLVLTEEIRFHLRTEEEAVSLPARIRRQSVAVERIPVDGPDLYENDISGESPIMRTLIAMFDSRREAERAAEALRGLNVNATNVHVRDKTAAERTDDDRHNYSTYGSLWMPEEDRATYDEGLRRGGAILSADVEEGGMDLAMDAMEAAGAVDLDAREKAWRSEGWTGAGTAYGAGAGSSMTSSRPDGTPGNPPGTMASRGVDKVAGTNVSGAYPEHEAGRTKTGTAASGTTRHAKGGKEEVIPLAEEKLRVGKRLSHAGRVRVRSYTVETPVEEKVHLREERVHVERHAADRPVSGSDAFRDRVIEAEESSEEAVVSKEARVTGEVVVNKESKERTETVRDTVRRTEVDVDESSAANDPRKRGGKGAA